MVVLMSLGLNFTREKKKKWKIRYKIKFGNKETRKRRFGLRGGLVWSRVGLSLRKSILTASLETKANGGS